jgi:anti-sigma regulatory factor (Ser/Thr protein kinase)
MEDLSLHILDIAENSIDAGASRIEIELRIKKSEDKLILSIKDNGKGMDDERIKLLKDPFFTTKKVRRFGLGIPLLAQSAEECNGRFIVESKPGEGTVITAEFQYSHIDRKPIGDIGSTISVLISGHPEKDFIFLYKRNGFTYCFDTEEFKKELNDVPINLPAILKLIKEDINSAIIKE